MCIISCVVCLFVALVVVNVSVCRIVCLLILYNRKNELTLFLVLPDSMNFGLLELATIRINSLRSA